MMKASELIAELQKLVAEHGDFDCCGITYEDERFWLEPADSIKFYKANNDPSYKFLKMQYVIPYDIKFPFALIA